MQEYPKIQSVYKRDPTTKFKTFLEGDWSLEEFGYLAYCSWVATEKINGTNIRIGWENGKLSFRGRADNAIIQTSLLSYLDNKFVPLAGRFEEIFQAGPVCLYGEGYGPKIQKGGGNYRSEVSFALFDIKIGHWWLLRKDMLEIAARLEIDIVPIIANNNLPGLIDLVKKGFKSKWGDFQAEGIVAQTEVPLFARNGDRIITKIKSKDFVK